jgi:galactosamine-6-phosphate isomerase
MKVLIYKDYASLSAFAANEVIRLIKEKPAAVICLASGDSPKLTCELFTQKAKEEKLDTSQFFFLGLDEWVGLAPDTHGSCHNDFKKRIFEPLNISPSQYHLFNGLSNDLKNECTEMDRIIQQKGDIDLMIVGIGMNGHIGFNEPGVDFKLLSHVIDLDATTISVGQKYFKQAVLLQKGVTLGLAHLMNAKKVFLVANGKRKADVIKKAVQEKVSEQFPASIMQQHPNGFILVDEEAGSLLDTTTL